MKVLLQINYGEQCVLKNVKILLNLKIDDY